VSCGVEREELQERRNDANRRVKAIPERREVTQWRGSATLGLLPDPDGKVLNFYMPAKIE
jgi:hypothetical protein